MVDHVASACNTNNTQIDMLNVEDRRVLSDKGDLLYVDGVVS